MRIQSVGVVALVIAMAAGCAGNVKAKKAKTSGFQADFDIVWQRVIDAVAIDYPVAKVVDKPSRRIVTCWRPIERSPNARIEGAPGSGWYFFRAIIEVSNEPPYRVSVSGRAAEYRPPQIFPTEHGDVNEPGWVEGRTDRVYAQIYEELEELAVQASGSVPPAIDPDQDENVTDTCVIRAAEFGIMWKGMTGVVLGEEDAAPETGRVVDQPVTSPQTGPSGGTP